MAKKYKVICKNILKNSNKTAITKELTEKIANLISRAENSSLLKKE